MQIVYSLPFCVPDKANPLPAHVCAQTKLVIELPVKV